MIVQKTNCTDNEVTSQSTKTMKSSQESPKKKGKSIRLKAQVDASQRSSSALVATIPSAFNHRASNAASVCGASISSCRSTYTTVSRSRNYEGKLAVAAAAVAVTTAANNNESL